MSVTSSTINKQQAEISSLLLPQGYALASGGGLSGNLPIEKGKAAYNLTDNLPYFCNGTTWASISGAENVTLTAFGSTPNANGATLTAQALTLQPASSTQPGGISTGSQTLAGVKSFTNGLIISPSVVTAGVVTTFTQQYHSDLGPIAFTGAAALTMNAIVMRTAAFGFINFGASNSATATASVLTIATPLDVLFRPGTTRTISVNVIDNGVFARGAGKITSGGVVTIGAGLDASGNLLPFTNAATCQVLDCSSLYSFA